MRALPLMAERLLDVPPASIYCWNTPKSIVVWGPFCSRILQMSRTARARFLNLFFSVSLSRDKQGFGISEWRRRGQKWSASLALKIIDKVEEKEEEQQRKDPLNESKRNRFCWPKGSTDSFDAGKSNRIYLTRPRLSTVSNHSLSKKKDRFFSRRQSTL